MKKFLIIIPILLLAIGGGFMLAQGKKDKSLAAVKISAEQAREAALAIFPGTIVGFEYDGDGFTPHYEIAIESTTEEAEVEVNANTGKAVIKERKALAASNNNADVKVAEAKAIEIAILHFSSNTGEKIDVANAQQYISKVELDKDDNIFVYDIELTTEKTKADIEVNANTGEVVKFETEDLTKTVTIKSELNQQAQQIQAEIINLQQAIELAKSKASGTVTKSKFDKDDQVYEIEIRNGKMEYEFEIDTKGNIVIYEEDLDN